MIRPDIKTYREDRRSHWISSDKHRSHFLGRSALDLRLKAKEPAVNIKRENSLFELEVALPGFSKEEISITIDHDILTIRGEKIIAPPSSSQYILQEFDIDVLERKFELASHIGQEEVKATYQNGILKLVFIDVPEEEERIIKKVAVE